MFRVNMHINGIQCLPCFLKLFANFFEVSCLNRQESFTSMQFYHCRISIQRSLSNTLNCNTRLCDFICANKPRETGTIANICAVCGVLCDI